MQPRVPPVTDPSELDDEARGLLERMSPGGRVLNVFATLVHHPKLLKRWLVFGNHILSKSTLSARHRELLILRTAHRCGSVYEWTQHSRIALAVGLTPQEVEDVAEDRLADPFEATLLRAADELIDDHVVSDATWATLTQRYDVRQMLDAMFTVGQYAMLAGALNSLGVQVESP